MSARLGSGERPQTRGVPVKRSALLLPALALALGLVTAGCGGSDDSLSHDEFVTQADKICADGNEDIEAAIGEIGDAPTEDDIAAYITDTLVPNIQDQHDAIEDLNASDDDQDAVDDMLSALQDGIDALEDDPAAITSDSDVFSDANAAADELGLSECGSE
jgi:hypothetical protein